MCPDTHRSAHQASRPLMVGQTVGLPFSATFLLSISIFFFFQAEDGIRDYKVTGVQTCALPIWDVGNSAGAGGVEDRLVGLSGDGATVDGEGESGGGGSHRMKLNPHAPVGNPKCLPHRTV